VLSKKRLKTTFRKKLKNNLALFGFFFFFFRQKFSQKLSQTCYWDCVKSIFNTSKTLSGKKNVDLKKIKNLKKLLFCSKNKLENENKTISSFFYKQKLAPKNRCGCVW
jgi:hypothetical protein